MKLAGNCKGSITIYQCLIFTALLILCGVLIDAARIMVAERKVQSALNTAVRSSLAAYDEDIVGGYGVFAVDTRSEEGKAELDANFNKYLKANLSPKPTSYQFINYDVDWNHTQLVSSGNLLAGNPDPLREQILKYMKYKGPITATGNIIEKLTSSGIFKKAEFSSKEKNARAARGALEKKAKEVNAETKKVNEAASRAAALDGRQYIDALKNLRGQIGTADKTAAEVEPIFEKYGKEKDAADTYAGEANKDKVLQQEGVQIKTGEKEFTGALEESRNTRSSLKKADGELESLINAIEPLQNRVDTLEAQKKGLESSNSFLYSRISSLSMEKDKDQDEIQRLQMSIEENNRAISQLQAEITALRQKIRDIREGAAITRIEGMSLPSSEVDPKEKPVGEADKSKLEELKSSLEKYLKNKNIDPAWLISPEEFKQAGDREKAAYEEMLALGIGNKKVLGSERDEEAAEAENNSILKYMDTLYHEVVLFFSEGGQASVEKLYITEYIMDKFTYHTSETERDHYLEKGEVEYILWGGTNQNGNIAKVFTSIGFLRLAINSIDYFATSSVPHPVLRLVYAIGRGLIQSCVDTYELYRGEDIPLCPSLKGKPVTFTVNYSDHLRIFLLLQSVRDEEGLLNNVRQLMQVNMKQGTDGETFRLGDYESKLTARAEVRINLLFLPVFHLDKLKIKGFEGGSYVVARESRMGY